MLDSVGELLECEKINHLSMPLSCHRLSLEKHREDLLTCMETDLRLRRLLKIKIKMEESILSLERLLNELVTPSTNLLFDTSQFLQDEIVKRLKKENPEMKL